MAYEISFFPDRIHQNSLQHFNIGRLGSKGLFQTNHAPNRWTLTSTFLHLQRNHNIHVRTYSYNVKLPVLIKYSSVAHWPHSSSFSHEQRFGKKIMSNSDGSNLIGIAFIFLFFIDLFHFTSSCELKIASYTKSRASANYCNLCNSMLHIPISRYSRKSEYPMCIYNILTYIFAQLSYRGSQLMN